VAYLDDREAACKALKWKYRTLKQYGSVSAAYEMSNRLDILTYKHHQIVAYLAVDNLEVPRHCLN